MRRMSRPCPNCGNQLAEDSKFCTQCGTPAPQGDAPQTASAGRSPQRQDDAPKPASESQSQTRQDAAPETAGEGGSRYRRLLSDSADRLTDPSNQRFLKVDPSGGFLAVVAPILVWSAAAAILTWAIIGLLSLRFDLGFINLPDLLFSMLIIVGIMLSIAANSYVVYSYRGRSGPLWQALSYLPVIWAVLLSVGLGIMIWQVWTDFAGGPNELRRVMFSLIGIGVCGTYSGYLSLVVVGPDRIYLVVRRVIYVLTAIIAVEILDALWWAAGDLSGKEIGAHFIRAGWTAAVCVVVSAIIAVFMAQVRARKQRIGVLVTYVVLGLTGFTIAVYSLWGTFPPGALRFIHGGIVIVSITTIGLLLVQHFHRNKDTRSLTADGGERSDQPSSPMVP